MSAANLENLMLLGAILAFGAIPASLDSARIKFGVPNYILSIILAGMVLIAIVGGTAGSFDAAATAFLLVGIPGITITYVVFRLFLWLLKPAFGGSTSSGG